MLVGAGWRADVELDDSFRGRGQGLAVVVVLAGGQEAMCIQTIARGSFLMMVWHSLVVVIYNRTHSGCSLGEVYYYSSILGLDIGSRTTAG